MLYLLIIIFYCTMPQADANKKDIFFSFITSKTGEFIVAGSIPMIEYALEEINNSTKLLSNYTLHHGEILDSQCKTIPSTDAFFEQFVNDSQPTYLALVCCGSSEATIPIAQISHYRNIPHLAFSAAATVLADKNRFKSFFQVLPPYDKIGPALTALCLRFGWKQMAIIAQPVDVFEGVANDMQKLFLNYNLKLYNSIRSNPIDTKTHTIFDWFGTNEDYRVIFINAYSNFAYEVLCEAYRLNMLYPKYVWITLAGYTDKWWLTGTSNVNISCPSSHVKAVLYGSIALEPQGSKACRKPFGIASTGMTFETFHQLNSQFFDDSYPLSSVVAPAYDTVWAVAMGLDITSQRIAQGNDTGCESLPGELLPLEQFDYTNEKMGCVIQQSIAAVNFRGITGKFKFNENKTRQSNLVIFTQYNKDMKLISTFVVRCHNDCRVSLSGNNSIHSIWGKRGIPYDGYTDNVYYPYPLPLQILYTVFGTLGIVFAGICCVFNNLFRNRKIVKMSSPNINNIVILGAIITYVAIYFTDFSFTGFHQATQQTIICNFHYWLSSIGYALCMSVVLVKSGRAYYIFSKPNIKKSSAIQEWKLVIICFVIVGIDVGILTIGTAFPMLRIQADLTLDGLNPLSVTPDGISQFNNVYYCNDKRIVLAVTFGYKVILQMIAIYLAFHTRQIKLRALNDSRQIAAMVLINSLLVTAQIATTFSSHNYRDITVTMEGLVHFLQASIFLGIIFVPNMIKLCFDPKGEKIKKAALSPTGANGQAAVLSVTATAIAGASSTHGTFVQLHKCIRELERELLKYKTAEDQKTMEELDNKIVSTKKVSFVPGLQVP